MKNLIKSALLFVSGFLTGVLVLIGGSLLVFQLTSFQNIYLDEIDDKPNLFKDSRFFTYQAEDGNDYLSFFKDDYHFLLLATSPKYLQSKEEQVETIVVQDGLDESIASFLFEGKKDIQRFQVFSKYDKEVVCSAQKNKIGQWDGYLFRISNINNPKGYENVVFWDLDGDHNLDLQKIFNKDQDLVSSQIFYNDKWIEVELSDNYTAKLKIKENVKSLVFQDSVWKE